MNKNKSNQQLLETILKWLFISIGIGVLSGSVSAFFLTSLEWVTQLRNENHSLVWDLPLGGFLIGCSYYYWGKSVEKGNNLLLEEYHSPKKGIPIKMIPLVLFGTLITHLFGGSAGREGTAVQMGGSIAYQFKNLLNLSQQDCKILILLGISAGFSSVFGTPFTGAIFAIEVLLFSKINYKTIPLSFITAFVAYYTVEFWHVSHTHYHIPLTPNISIFNFGLTIAVSILFGLTALLFSRSTHFWNSLFKKNISYPPFRPLIGGTILAFIFIFFNFQKFEGLGVPVIVKAFESPNQWYDFLLKIVFTSFTLGCGFKGGEVTPLFFIGATLGSTLSVIIPLPIALLAGMGFVAVFAGATHTPIACTIMGIELFGFSNFPYIAVACFIAYFCSGMSGIYQSQILGGPKHHFYQKLKIKKLKNL